MKKSAVQQMVAVLKSVLGQDVQDFINASAGMCFDPFVLMDFGKNSEPRWEIKATCASV